MTDRVDWRSATRANAVAASLAAVPPRTRATAAGYGLAFTAGCALTALVILGAVNVLAAPDFETAAAGSPAAIASRAAVATAEAAPPVGQYVTSAPDASAAERPTEALDANECQLPAWLPSTVSRWRDGICTAARAHGIDPALLAIVVTIESCGGKGATSGSGATSLTQVMPATGAGIAAERGIATFDLYDPATSLDFGAYYLAQQLRTFGRADDPDWATSVGLACVAYNGGPGTAIRYRAGGALPAETSRYFQWCSGMWRERKNAVSGTFDTWYNLASGMCARAAQGG